MEGGFSRVPLTADGAGLPILTGRVTTEDSDRATVVWGAGVLVDGSLDVERRLTLLPTARDPIPVTKPLGVASPPPDALGASDDGTDAGDEIEPFIIPEENP